MKPGPPRKTHCQRGHEMTPENTKWDTRGWRQCRACQRAAQRRYDRKHRRRRYVECPECGGRKVRAAPRCKACDVKRRRFARREATEAALRAYAGRYGHPPSATEWNGVCATFGAPTVNQIQDDYGSWSNGIKAAGLDPKQRMRERTPSTQSGATIRP